ncbi:MAG: glycosyltransferase family 4 protein, partial [Candidatus Omnitrophica bacterium]|nr:glycosyltransferase family 4 protein [Candidatus Omnitrophota bacterium]
NVRIVFAGEYLIKYEDFYDRCAELVDQYKDYLCFLGLVTDDREMACFYSMCDVLALPSGTECFGLVQVESMLFGTPVVATDIPGAREVVRVTGMGELVPKGEERALGEAIVRVLGNRERYVRPREEIEKIFSLRRTVDEYERVFQESIEALCPKGG